MRFAVRGNGGFLYIFNDVRRKERRATKRKTIINHRISHTPHHLIIINIPNLILPFLDVFNRGHHREEGDADSVLGESTAALRER